MIAPLSKTRLLLLRRSMMAGIRPLLCHVRQQVVLLRTIGIPTG